MRCSSTEGSCLKDRIAAAMPLAIQALRYSLQRCGVKPQMIFHERRDEIVTVIVAFMSAQPQRLAGGRTGGFEEFREQLRLLQKLVGAPLIHQDFREHGAACSGHEFNRIVGAPGGLILTEIARQGLAAPGTT